MAAALLLARCFLALVFAVAAAGKLADRVGLRKALREFGVARPLAAAGASVLPLAEIAVAVLLIPLTTARMGAIAALGLLTVFCVAIGRALARGERPECNCFGQVHSAPVGRGTLARNGALGAAACLVAVAGPGASVRAAIAEPRATLAVAFGLLSAALAFVLWLLLRRHGQVLAQLEALAMPDPDPDPEVGAPAPPFTLQSVAGGVVSLGDLLAPGLPALVVFADPGCGPCAALFPEIGRWQAEHADRLTVAVVSRGDNDLNLAQAEEHGIENLLIEAGPEIAEAYRVGGTPGAVLVGSGGRLASRPRYGADGVRSLLAEALAAPPQEMVLVA